MRRLAGHGLTVALTLAAGVAVAVAEPVAVTGDAVKEVVIGKTIDLDTPLGLPISIHYQGNGLVSATAGAALAIYLGAAADRGRWWIADGRLCQKFFKWLEGETSCLRIRLDGRRIFWARDDGKRGTATIIANGPVRTPPAYGLGGADLALARSSFPTKINPARSRRSLPFHRPKASDPFPPRFQASGPRAERQLSRRRFPDRFLRR